MNIKQIAVYSFYRFTSIKNKKEIILQLKNLFKMKLIKGSIYIANEGINGSIAGDENDLEIIIKEIKKLLSIRKLSLKINYCHFIPFYKLRIRDKKEIVSLNVKRLNINDNRSSYISSSEWNNIIKNKDFYILDTRNKYETKIGRFKNSINLQLDNFREFPTKFDNLNLDKNKKIAMYCTGGIRCEKAQALLKEKGFNRVFQLKGGIIDYLNYVKTNKSSNYWSGDCFVFDNRVSINKKLSIGKYIQCHGCKNPITKKDINSEYYVKGVSCPNCYNKRSIKQKKRSADRQKQIYLAENNNKNHPFKKILSENI